MTNKNDTQDEETVNFAAAAAQMMEDFVDGKVDENNDPVEDGDERADDDNSAGAEDGEQAAEETPSTEAATSANADAGDTGAAADASAAEGAAADSPEDAEADHAAEVQQVQEIPAPVTMSNADKEKFAQLTPEMQQWLTTRENDRNRNFSRTMQRTAEFRNEYEPVAEMFAPHAAELREAGLTPAKYIQQLVNLDQRARSNPLDYIGFVMDTLKVNPYHVAQKLGLRVEAPKDEWGNPINDPRASEPMPRPGAPMRPVEDPEIIQMRLENRRLRGQQDQIQMQPFVDQVETFRTATTDDGSAKHPYFDLLVNDMLQMNVDEIGLDEAYVRAAQFRGLPSPGSHLPAQNGQNAQLAPAQAASNAHPAGDSVADAKTRIAKAKAANKVGSSTPASTPEPPDVATMSTAELIAHNMAQSGLAS